MSDGGEEKEAIELIGEAEKEIRVRLDAALRKAKQVVTDAERRASEIVRSKESELKALEAAGYLGQTKPTGADGSIVVPTLPQELIDRLAGEIFARIIAGAAEGLR